MSVQPARVMKIAKDAIREAAVMESRNEADTIRLWENYKDQALLWRSLALLQIPTTLLALIFSIFLWHSRSITLDVPREPLPGVYSATEIPDHKFVEAAVDFVNLIASYTPANARIQFSKAREMIKEPLLLKFDDEMMGAELKTIENTGRIQLFFVDPTKTLVDRPANSEIRVQLDGDRLKVVGGKQLPSSATRFLVTLTTVPRNVLNPYGIVVSNIQFAALNAGGN